MKATKHRTHPKVGRSGMQVSFSLALFCALAATQAQAQITIPASTKVTADTTKPGFLWRVFQNNADQVNSTAKSEAAIAGTLSKDGALLPNLADPAAQGPASAPGIKLGNAANALVEFIIPEVINFSQTEGENNGNFTPDLQMPGVPGTEGGADGIAAEIITYLDLPAGEVTMGVNSDDGFRTQTGLVGDAFRGLALGEFTGGRGAADTVFKFNVPEAGVYPFRTTWEEGGGGANVEWFTVKTDGTKVLVNDTANGGVKAYRAATTGPKPPIISSVVPGPSPRQLNVASSTVTVVLQDGDNVTITDSSIDFKVDGVKVADIKRNGKQITLTYKPEGLQFPEEVHSAELTFAGSEGFTRSEKWTFKNLKNVILPSTPIASENFDSTPETGTVKGWVATNFTPECDAGEDPTNQRSDTFRNWAVLAKENMLAIDDAGHDQVNASETVNGQKLTIDMLRSGNVLYAESDSRCNGTARADVIANKDGMFGQTQFIVSAPFNLSAAKNPVLTFSSGYMQNQDSYGGVEYSVDGGKTFMPVVYFLDVPDIIVAADGSVDGVATFNAVQGDTSLWVENGVVKGERYGDAVAAKIDSSIGNYIAPRVNDDGVEGKRIEIFRLPAAANKADVRLRFSATGSDSWYFFVDNIAFYDIAPPAPAAGAPLLAENFDAVDTAGLVAKGWNLGKNEFALEDGTDFVVAPPFAKATPEAPALPGSDFKNAAGDTLVNPPGERGLASTGKFLISDSDTAGGSDNINSNSEFWAITPGFSTVGLTEVWYHADLEIDNNNNGECVVEIAATIDDGKTWIPMWQTVEPQRPEKSLSANGSVPPGGDRTGGYPELGSASQIKSWGGIHGRFHVKLPAAALNKPNVKIRIEYFEPADAWWIAVDNVVIDTNPPPQGKDVVLAEAFEGGIPSTWKKGNKKGQNWGTEALKDADGNFLLKQNDEPINVDLVKEAAKRGIAKGDILNPDKNAEFDRINPNGGGLDGKWMLMLAGGNYAIWQEGADVEEQSTLDTPSIDLTNAEAVFFEFDSELVQRNGSSINEVFVSTDNGATFTQIFTYNGALGDRGEGPYFMKHYIAVPEAARKNNVIFRFSAIGGDPNRYEGFWAIDNVRVTANLTGVVPPKLSAARSGDKLTLTWTGTGTLESASNVTGPWAPVAGASSGVVVTTSSAAQFYRIKR